MEIDYSNASDRCVVCADKASGNHYGVKACHGCKGFFRRSVRQQQQYVCRFDGRCNVDTDRTCCRYCRYQKCLHVGMKTAAVQRKRDKISRSKSSNSISSIAASSVIVSPSPDFEHVVELSHNGSHQQQLNSPQRSVADMQRNFPSPPAQNDRFSPQSNRDYDYKASSSDNLNFSSDQNNGSASHRFDEGMDLKDTGAASVITSAPIPPIAAPEPIVTIPGTPRILDRSAADVPVQWFKQQPAEGASRECLQVSESTAQPLSCCSGKRHGQNLFMLLQTIGVNKENYTLLTERLTNALKCFFKIRNEVATAEPRSLSFDRLTPEGYFLATRQDVCALTNLQLQALVRHYKKFTVLRAVSTDDQVELIRSNASEFLLWTCAFRSQTCNDALLLSDGKHIVPRDSEDLSFARELIASILDELVGAMKSLRIDEVEFNALRALSLLKPDIVTAGPGREFLRARKRTIQVTLEYYEKEHYSWQIGRLSELMLLLTTLQRIAQRFRECANLGSMLSVIQLDPFLEDVLLDTTTAKLSSALMAASFKQENSQCQCSAAGCLTSALYQPDTSPIQSVSPTTSFGITNPMCSNDFYRF